MIPNSQQYLLKAYIELKTIVRNEGVRDPEPGNNVFPDEHFGIHFSDVRQSFSFNPFGKVVSANEQISFVPYCLGKGPDDIQAPLRKWPRVGQWIEDPSRLMYVWHKPLILVTLLHVFMCFFLHVWLPVALDDGPMR